MEGKLSVFAVTILMITSGMAGTLGGETREEEIVTSEGSQLESYPFRYEYPSVQRLYDWYDDLVERNSEITEKIHLGESWEGRDMWTIKVSDNVEAEEDEPSVFIHGNIHAREWSSCHVAAYYLWRVVNDYGSNETITWLVNNRQIYVAPMVNPDGYIYDGDGNLDHNGEGKGWRKNRNEETPTHHVGVDLNRNWDFKWEKGSTDPGEPIYRGESPFSEYETRNLRDFILAKDIDSYLDLHSYWGALLIPGSIEDPPSHYRWYGDMADDMTSLTSKLGGEEEQYSSGMAEVVLPGYEGSVPGNSINWVYEETGAISLSYEIYTGDPREGASFYPPKDDIMDINRDLYDSLVYQARIADLDLGEVDEDLNPSSPYILYGALKDEEGDPVVNTSVTIEILDTGETISKNTDQNGYYELNFGNFVEEGYDSNDTFSFQTESYSVNFTIDDRWGQRLDLKGSEFHQLSIDIEGEGTVEVDGKKVTEWPCEEGEEVRIEAAPGEGWKFVGWAGDVPEDEEGKETTITIEEDKEITAIFEEKDEENEMKWACLMIAVIVVILAMVGYSLKGGEESETQDEGSEDLPVSEGVKKIIEEKKEGRGGSEEDP